MNRNGTIGRRAARRGSAYLMTLGACLIVTVLGVATLLAMRVELHQTAGRADIAKARQYAQAGLDMALYRIVHDALWRWHAASWTADQPVGDGSYSFTLTDPIDGDLTNSITDPVVVTATGKCGAARQKMRVALDVELPGFECLRSAVHAGNDVTFKGITTTMDHWASANHNMAAVKDGVFGSVVNADCAAAAAITKDTESVYNGVTTLDGAWPKSMPDPNTVLDYYLAAGTRISPTDLPTWDAQLLVNPSFEAVPAGTGWTPYGTCQLVTNSTFKKYGTLSLLAKDRVSQKDGPGQNVTALIANGVTYNATLYFYLPYFDDYARISLRIESTGSLPQTFSTPWKFAAEDTWEKATGDLTPTWTGELTLAMLYVETWGTSQSFYIDGDTKTAGDGSAFYEKPLDTAYKTSRVIHRQVLSPTRNPFGAGTTNPEGIYIIDFAGTTPTLLSVQRSRIAGTLVVLNGEAYVWGSVVWAPAVANYPALLSNKNVHFWLGAQGASRPSLEESRANVNFNPAGTPYDGLEDSDKSDVYDGLVRGIIYTTKAVDFQYHPVLEGVVLAHENIVSAATGGVERTYFDVTYLSRYYRNAPPGFRVAPIMKVAPGSFRQVVD